ncbi:MAG: ABC transporter permease [Oscillospiraceae bacterium]|nr:ABC transporter permease [Oscillospiraceae bacterium]
MDLKKSKRLLIVLAVIFWVFAIGIYAIGFEQFRASTVSEDVAKPQYVIGEIVDGMELEQTFTVPVDSLHNVSIMMATYNRTNTGFLTLTLSSEGGILWRQITDISTIADNQYLSISLPEPVSVKPGGMLRLQLSTQGCSTGNAVTVYAGSSDSAYMLNGLSGEGGLTVHINGEKARSFYIYYWLIVSGMFLLALCYVLICWKAAKRGKTNGLVSLCTVYSRYSFLIKQLVSRDFKTKYKRSALGMAWSFVNPLLTMSVQYVVFSTLFRTDIPNYPVYLLTGIVFFTFFNEATTMGMTAITGNAALIKKVYMPKYIYPVSRIISSLVNFAFALMPLFLVMLLTGTPFRWSMLLLLFDILCLLAFVTGMTLLLTTAMTFFQDTQFLWSVVGMMWQYLTPIFYPESIIPASILPIYRLNPLYQFITFARTCITGGVSPAPEAYAACMVSGGLVLLLGMLVFKKHQNKFVLYV